MITDATPPNTEQVEPETNQIDRTGHKNDVARHVGRRLQQVLGLNEATARYAGRRLHAVLRLSEATGIVTENYNEQGQTLVDFRNGKPEYQNGEEVYEPNARKRFDPKRDENANHRQPTPIQRGNHRILN